MESTDEKFDDGKLAGATILGGTGGMAYMEEKSEVVEQYLLNVSRSQQVAVMTCLCVPFLSS